MDNENKRSEINVEVLELLLESSKTELVGPYYPTLSRVILRISEEYLSTDHLTLPYNPARVITGGALLALFEREFPKRRTTVSVTSTYYEYKSLLEFQAKQQFNISAGITNRYAIEVALYRAHQKYSIPLESYYFQDDYIAEFLNPKNVIKEIILSIYTLLGRSPTSREYQKYRTIFCGPSLSFVKEQFNSFNDAKKFAGIETWSRGR